LKEFLLTALWKIRILPYYEDRVSIEENDLMLDVISKDYAWNCFDNKPFIIPEYNILTIRT